MTKDLEFTAWVTKYALTHGIFSTPVRLCQNSTTSMVSDLHPDRDKHGGTNYHGNDWHRTREEAIAHAEKMRVKKIASLEKSIAKFKALDFGDAE